VATLSADAACQAQRRGKIETTPTQGSISMKTQAVKVRADSRLDGRRIFF